MPSVVNAALADREGAAPLPLERIAIIGSGAWGSAVSMLLGSNAARHESCFEREVRMWVHEEEISPGGGLLTSHINTWHINSKYLPGRLLPSNVIADADLRNVVRGASLLVFVLPHMFITEELLTAIREGLGPSRVRAISLIKGALFEDGELILATALIRRGLGASIIDVSCLSGANIADDVAVGHLAEATIGCSSLAAGSIWRTAFDTPTFATQLCMEAEFVELCGVLKNVVALAIGFADGLGQSINTRALIIRRALLEMITLASEVLPPHCSVSPATLLESCGVADTVASAIGGRNRRCGEHYVRTGGGGCERWGGIERELLGGGKLQGTHAAWELVRVLEHRACDLSRWPLFVVTARIASGEVHPDELLRVMGGGMAAAV